MHHERGNSHTSIIDMGITLTGKMIVDSLSASSSINGDSDGNDDLNDIINTGSIAFARSSIHALGQNVLVTVPKKSITFTGNHVIDSLSSSSSIDYDSDDESHFSDNGLCVAANSLK